VWAGFDQPRPVAPNGYATSLVVPIWARFMRDATSGASAAWLAQPDTVVQAEVCLRSGLKPTSGCTEVGFEYFHQGTEPEQWCEIHCTE